jgi:hypothetical protein
MTFKTKSAAGASRTTKLKMPSLISLESQSLTAEELIQLTEQTTTPCCRH